MSKSILWPSCECVNENEITMCVGYKMLLRSKILTDALFAMCLCTAHQMCGGKYVTMQKRCDGGGGRFFISLYWMRSFFTGIVGWTFQMFEMKQEFAIKKW